MDNNRCFNDYDDFDDFNDFDDYRDDLRDDYCPSDSHRRSKSKRHDECRCKDGRDGRDGRDGQNGQDGQDGRDGRNGRDADPSIIPFASGTAVTLQLANVNTLPRIGAAIGFGNSSSVRVNTNGTIDLTPPATVQTTPFNMAFYVPRDGIITSIAAQFTLAAPLNISWYCYNNSPTICSRKRKQHFYSIKKYKTRTFTSIRWKFSYR
jgi:hypothetical protein